MLVNILTKPKQAGLSKWDAHVYAPHEVEEEDEVHLLIASDYGSTKLVVKCTRRRRMRGGGNRCPTIRIIRAKLSSSSAIPHSPVYYSKQVINPHAFPIH